MEYLFFDLDGTLTDPMVGITKSAQNGLRHMGIEVEDHKSLSFFIGPPLRDTYREQYGMSEEEAEEAIRAFREYFVPTGIFENEIYPGIADMLKKLTEAGKKLVVATSKPEAFAERILDYFDITRYFTLVAGSTLEETRTKKSEVLSYALAQLKLPEEHPPVVMVGDRSYDVEGAAAFGIPTVGVTFGYGGREELQKAGAWKIVDSVSELEALLLEL